MTFFEVFESQYNSNLMKIVMFCTEKIIFLKKITGIDTVYCEKLTLFDPKSPFFDPKSPLTLLKMAPNYGLCIISTTK